jgi:YggT family protein
MLIPAITRGDVSNYVGSLFEVYIIVIFVYVLLSMMFSLGLRPPFARWTDVLLGFLKDVSEPYLRIFRRLLPAFGGLDLSPMIGIFVLIIADQILTHAIRG